VAEIVRWTMWARRPSGELVFERCGTDRSRTVEHAPRLHAVLGRTLRADTRDLLVVLQRSAHRFVDVAEDVGEVEWVRGAVSRMPCTQAAMYGWDEAGEPSTVVLEREARVRAGRGWGRLRRALTVPGPGFVAVPRGQGGE
jgi:hypothetical protein